MYVDGFNLFYGALRRTSWRWLNLARLGDAIAGARVHRVVYCTATVAGTRLDPGKPIRHQAYLKALGADGRVDVVRGRFLRSKVIRQLCDCRDPGPACFARIFDDEEKGSDVNLASRMLHDGHLGRYDRAILVTGDSDLVEPIRLLVEELRKHVEVVNPRKGKSRELAAVASGYATLDRLLIQRSQFPEVVEHPRGDVVRPREWAPDAADRSGASRRHEAPGCCGQTAVLELRKFGGANADATWSIAPNFLNGCRP